MKRILAFLAAFMIAAVNIYNVDAADDQNINSNINHKEIYGGNVWNLSENIKLGVFVIGGDCFENSESITFPDDGGSDINTDNNGINGDNSSIDNDGNVSDSSGDISEDNQNNASDSEITDSEVGVNEFEKRVLELVNEERAKYGLNSLSWNNDLANVARAYSKDMNDRNFFSHVNPDGKSPFDRIKEYGISYRTAAENIAFGQKTPEQVMNSWMNSEGHRSNILNANMKYIGVGFYQEEGGRAYWTQCFTG